MPRTVSFKNVGTPNTPQEIKRLRRQNLDSMRHLGQPVIFRHVFGLQDVDSGLAKKCPACYDPAYDQTRFDCLVCYGQGFVSVEDNPDPLWIDQDGEVVESLSPQSGWVRAPRYGGFDVPYLTWVVEPDVAVDVFRLNEQGALVQQFDSKAYAPWTPTMGDNDLIVNVQLGANDFSILDTYDRFQLKMVQQVTARGLGRLARGQRNGLPFLIMQSFDMNKVPVGNILQQVPVDEVWY